MTLDLLNSQELVIYMSMIDILYSMFLTVPELSEPWRARALENHGMLLQCLSPQNHVI
jgi:hypothetical protein